MKASMKAVVLKGFGPVDGFRLANLPMPGLKEDQVLVKITATAFNPIDYQMRRGDAESSLFRSSVLGREFSGIVEAVGKAVDNFAPGDAVAAYISSLTSNGTYAEYISVPEQMLAKKPDSLSFAQAAALPLVGLTALQCLKRLSPSPAARVFVSGGAGGVGTMVLQMLKSAGVRQIVTTAGNPQSRLHLYALGLHDSQVVDYRQANLVQNVRGAIEGGEFDFCIDLVGGALSGLCAEVLKVEGTYVDVTFLSTEAARRLLFDKAALILNIANYAHALSGQPGKLAAYGENLQMLFQRIEAKELSPAPVQIVGNLSAETVKKAHLLLEANETKGKKLVMVMED